MTTITINRATVEQALEALELGDEWHPSTLAAIAALRAALAQQTEPVEPVAHLWQQNETGRTRVVTPDQFITADDGWHMVGPLYTAPPQRKPLPNHDQHCVNVSGYGLMAVRLVRAVERAHGIGEGERC